MQICRQISIQSLIEIVWGRDWPGNIVAPSSLSSHWYHSGASSRASKANNDKETGAKLAISLLFQVFAFDKLLVFVYFLISDLEFGQRVKKKKECKDSWWHTLKVSQKKSPLQKYVSVRQCRFERSEQKYKHTAKTCAPSFCCTRSKGFAEPVGDLQIAIVRRLRPLGTLKYKQSQ